LLTISDFQELKGKFEEGVKKHYEQQANIGRNELIVYGRNPVHN